MCVINKNGRHFGINSTNRLPIIGLSRGVCVLLILGAFQSSLSLGLKMETEKKRETR